MGHSLGVLWLLTRRPEWCDRLVSVNGFPRFTSAPGYPGVPVRSVERMLARLPEDPKGVLDAFRTRCGAGRAPDDPDVDALRQGLELLRDGDARDIVTDKGVLALAGHNDLILPPNMMELAFPGAEVRYPAEGHLLPRNAPEAVVQAVRDMVPR